MGIGQETLAIVVVQYQPPNFLEVALFFTVLVDDVAQVGGGLVVVETKHLGEFRFKGQYFGDVVPAGQVVHGDGQHTGAEAGADGALADTCLYHLEEGAQEAFAGGALLVERVLVGGEQLVGEVVVLVNEDVEFGQVVVAYLVLYVLQHHCGIVGVFETKTFEEARIACPFLHGVLDDGAQQVVEVPF